MKKVKVKDVIGMKRMIMIHDESCFDVMQYVHCECALLMIAHTAVQHILCYHQRGTHCSTLCALLIIPFPLMRNQNQWPVGVGDVHFS